MATNLELFSLLSNSDLQDKSVASVLKAAQQVIDEDPATVNHVSRLIWAKKSIKDPKAMGLSMMPAVLAANAGATIGTIIGASDSVLDSNILSVIDLFADGN